MVAQLFALLKRVHRYCLKLPLAHRGERVVGIAEFSCAVQVPFLGQMQRGVEDAGIFVDRDRSAHRVTHYDRDRPLMRNALADVAVAGRRYVRANRARAEASQLAVKIVDHVLLPIVVVGQRAIDAGVEASRCRASAAGINDGLVARSTGS